MADTTTPPAGSTPPAATLAPRQVVHFVRVDPVFGTRLDQAGVVVDVVGDQVLVAPVAGYVVQVPAADVEPLVSVDEDAAG